MVIIVGRNETILHINIITNVKSKAEKPTYTSADTSLDTSVAVKQSITDMISKMTTKALAENKYVVSPSFHQAQDLLLFQAAACPIRYVVSIMIQMGKISESNLNLSTNSISPTVKAVDNMANASNIQNRLSVSFIIQCASDYISRFD